MDGPRLREWNATGRAAVEVREHAAAIGMSASQIEILLYSLAHGNYGHLSGHQISKWQASLRQLSTELRYCVSTLSQARSGLSRFSHLGAQWPVILPCGRIWATSWTVFWGLDPPIEPLAELNWAPDSEALGGVRSVFGGCSALRNGLGREISVSEEEKEIPSDPIRNGETEHRRTLPPTVRGLTPIGSPPLGTSRKVRGLTPIGSPPLGTSRKVRGLTPSGSPLPRGYPLDWLTNDDLAKLDMDKLRRAFAELRARGWLEDTRDDKYAFLVVAWHCARDPEVRSRVACLNYRLKHKGSVTIGHWVNGVKDAAHIWAKQVLRESAAATPNRIVSEVADALLSMDYDKSRRT